MRLIDADVLMKEFAEVVKESNNSDFADVPNWNDAVSLLGSAPTVDAIPVEWIEEWGWKNGMSESMSLRVMIDDWRKEIDDEVPVTHGHWINHYDDLFPEESTKECSVCHAEQMVTMLDDNYCPHCGTKMERKEE